GGIAPVHFSSPGPFLSEKRPVPGPHPEPLFSFARSAAHVRRGFGAEYAFRPPCLGTHLVLGVATEANDDATPYYRPLPLHELRPQWTLRLRAHGHWSGAAVRRAPGADASRPGTAADGAGEERICSHGAVRDLRPCGHLHASLSRSHRA